MTKDPKKPRILIVEDEIIIAADLESRLEGFGYTVCGLATSAEEALLLVEREQPDLVLMDIVLKGRMDGIEAAEVIKEKWGIPVVFLSAYTDTIRLERAKLTYPFGYLVKPFEDRNLKVTVEMALYAVRVDTERKEAEEALRLSEAKYRGLVETQTELICRYNSEWILTFVNAAYAQYFGKEPEQLLGTSFMTLIPEEERRKVKEMHHELLQSNQVQVTHEHRVIRGDGTHRWQQWINKALYDRKGKFKEYQSVGRDVDERRHMEEALRESERNFRLVNETITDVFWLNTCGIGETIFISPAYETIWERPMESLYQSPRSFMEDIHPDDLDDYLGVIDKYHKNGRPYECEYRIIRRSGEIKWIYEKGYPVARGSGLPKLMSGVCTDITDRKEAEMVQASRLRLVEYAAKHSVKELLQRFLDETEVLTGSEIGFYHFLDEDRETLLLQTWSTNTIQNICTAEGEGLHYPLSKAGVWVDCVRERSPLIHNDYQNLEHKKGMPEGHAPVIRELVVPVFREGKIKAILGVGNKKTDYLERDVKIVSALADLAWDIVERKQAEEALQKSEERYILATKGGNVGVWDWNLLTGDMFISPNLKAMLGYEDDEIGNHIEEWGKHVCREDVEAVMEEANACIDGLKEDYLVEHRMVHKDGSLRWFLASGKVVRDPGGKPIRFYGTDTDITTLKNLEAQLLNARKMEAVGTLAGGVAHDFNNLLQAINGFAQILIMDKTESDPDYSSLISIRNAGNHAAELVRQLLLFSRKIEADRQPVELNVEVGKAIRMLERTIPKPIDIEIHPGTRLWDVNADPVQIEQVLFNLVGNAADAMPDGGKLVIETKNITLDDEHAGNHLGLKKGDYVILTVSDTGHGMDPETMEHIFEPFFTTKEIGKGTGLGLASVYGIVKSNGGGIACRSEVGRGTTFEVYLPAIGSIQDEAGDSKTERIEGGTETILLVDDEETIRAIASNALEKCGYTVLTASCGEEALELYSTKSNEIDLVLMDMGLPGMGGHHCIEEIMKINPSARIIITGGDPVADQTGKTLEAGAAAYVRKPFEVNDLLDKVRKVLDGGN